MKTELEFKRGNILKRLTLLVLSLPLMYYAIAYTIENFPIIFPFVGPINKPNIKKYEWESLRGFYWLVAEEGKKVPRRFDVSKSDIDSLRPLFKIRKIQGFGIQCSSERNRLVLQNGAVWLFNFSLPQCIHITLQKNQDFSYLFYFDSNDFYNTFRTVCWRNELQHTPYVSIENIKVCSGGIGWTQESIVPYRACPEVLEGLENPGIEAQNGKN